MSPNFTPWTPPNTERVSIESMTKTLLTLACIGPASAQPRRANFCTNNAAWNIPPSASVRSAIASLTVDASNY
jgi:hypothetical protein